MQTSAIKVYQKTRFYSLYALKSAPFGSVAYLTIAHL